MELRVKIISSIISGKKLFSDYCRRIIVACEWYGWDQLEREDRRRVDWADLYFLLISTNVFSIMWDFKLYVDQKKKSCMLINL